MEGSEFIIGLVEGFMKGIKSELRARDMYVSGMTESLFEVKSVESSKTIEVSLYGPSYMFNLIHGRGPTTGGAGGGQTLQQKLLEWVKARGIGEPSEQESISWAMAKHMHNKGNRGESPSGKSRYAGNKTEQIMKKVITPKKINEAIDKLISKQTEKIFMDFNKVLI